MFAHVIPIRRTPKQFEIVVYQLPEGTHVRRGQIVTVPFRTQTIIAIVMGTTGEQPPYATRAVLAAQLLALTSEQLRLMEWMRECYQCSFTQLSGLFAPGSLSEKNAAPPPSPRKTELILERTPLDRHLFVKKMQAQYPDGQILYLVPEIEFAPKIENAVLYHGSLKENDRAASAQDIASSGKKIIIGTRLAFFLPFANLRSVIIDNEEHPSFAEKRTPQYDSLEVAQKLASLHGANLSIISHCPRTTTWHAAQTEKMEKIEWKASKTARITIISLDDERKKGNYGMFAQSALEEIARCFSRQQQVLIFINRKGYAGALYCRDCAQTARCQACGKTISVRADGMLLCIRCKAVVQQPKKCSNCSGVCLIAVGAGTDKVAGELKKIFAKAKILKAEGQKKTLLKLGQLQTADAIVATSLIDRPISLPRLTLSLVADFEALLSHPNINSSEKAMHLLQRLRLLTQPEGTIAVQTHLPENDLLRDFTEANFARFYERELATRKLLMLPPFSTHSHDDHQTPSSQTEQAT